MKNKISLLLILALTLCLSGRSWAYEAAVLMSADIKPYDEALEGFRSACGCNVKTLTANGMENGEITDEIRRLSPDVVVAVGMDALAEVRTIRDLPVVYIMVPGPISKGVVERNLSGVSMDISPSRYLDEISKLFPWARRIGLVYDPKNSGAYVKDALKEAGSRGIDLVVKKAVRNEDVPSLMTGMKDKIDIFWMLPEMDLLNSATVDYMLLFSFENKIPIVSFSKKYVDMGAAVALTIDPFHMGLQAGKIAQKLYETGGKGQIRVDADVSGLVINLRVLEKLGIKVDKKAKGYTKDAD